MPTDLWRPCPCPLCDGQADPEHALVDVEDAPTGERYPVAIPSEYRHDPVGWGKRPRVVHADGYGLEVGRDAAGLRVLGADGQERHVAHGAWKTWSPETGETAEELGLPKNETLRKAAALKAGERWITAFPNGRENKGVPILIHPNPDGTYRVIGGADSKLNHLRLRNVASPEEYAARAKAKAEGKAAERAAKSPEDRQAERQSKEQVALAKKDAERKFVESVRSKLGGVSEDLDEKELKGMSPRAQKMLLGQHHRKQLREAHEVKAKAARQLVEGATPSEFVARSTEEDETVDATARDLAVSELEADAQEEHERREERALRRLRGPSKVHVGDEATENAVKDIEDAEDPTDALEQYGGRGKPMKVDTASDELQRRSLVAADDARRLVDASKGGAMDATTKKVVEEAYERAGLDLTTPPEDAADVLQAEAARRSRRGELQAARAERLRDVEAEGDDGQAKALSMLAYCDSLKKVAGDVATAKKMGLGGDGGAVPLQPVEADAIVDVLRDAANLRAATKAFRAMNKEAEAGDYDRSRRAFDLKVDETAPESVLQDAHDEIRTELARQIAGVADPKRSEHGRALAAGHYDALADASLAVGRQRYLDRATVDAVGVKNAAILTRHALEQDGHDPDVVRVALERHHVATQADTTRQALAAAEKAAPGLTTTVEDAGSIEDATRMLDSHSQDLDEAQRAIGSALGKMEAHATLGQAFRDKIPDSLEVGDKHTDLGTTLQWLHAAGLGKGDYHVDDQTKRVTIPRASWDKLVHRVSDDEVAMRERVGKIKGGEEDEKGWLPPGIVRRSESSFTAPTPDAPRYWQPLHGDNLEDHVGSRLAEGEQPHEILTDLLSPKAMEQAPDRDAYVAKLKALFPLVDDLTGAAKPYEQQLPHFQKLAEDFSRKKYGTDTAAFHAQDLGVDDKKTQDAVFRTLAEAPEGAVAWKPVGTLTPQDSAALRDHFYKRMGLDPKTKVEEARFQKALTDIGGEPPKEGTLSMFGGGKPGEPGPEWRAWDAKRQKVFEDFPRESHSQALERLGPEPRAGSPEHEKWTAQRAAIADAVSKAPTAWSKYVETHGSLELAQQAMQDELRGDFVDRFRGHYGKLTGKGVQVGVQPVTNRERHVRAVDPEEGTRLRAEAQALYAQLQDRNAGRFAGAGEGSLKERFTRSLEQETIANQNQGAMFGKATSAAPKRNLDPKAGERLSLGARAESQIASLVGRVGAQFDPKGGATGLFPGLNMDGPRVDQQRALKVFDANGGRMNGWLGTGSGKSLISIGAFTHQHAQGKAQRGLFLVPTAVQQQFGGEMLRYTEPGKYRWKTGDGASHAERVAMLKDPGLHMTVMTHQSFRDTATKLMAENRGVDVATMKADLAKAPAREAATWWKEAREKNGIPAMFHYVDEAQSVTEREGQDPSAMNRVIRAVTHPMNATQYLAGSATPHKNDESEVYSQASMVDPARYGDRSEFMGAFGQGLDKNPDAIRRELDHRTYSARILPEGVDRTDLDDPVKLEGENKARVDRVQAAYDKASKARAAGGVDVEAIKELSPHRFESAPEAEHEQIARNLQQSIGILRESAMRRAINQAPAEHNQKLQAMTKQIQEDLKAKWTDRKGTEQTGRPSIVFSDSTEDGRLIAEHLKSKGIRVGTYHGGLSTREREEVRRGFQPEGGEAPKYDVLVSSSAAEAGVNIQRAKVVHHWDVPQTAKSHTQRSGRAYRQGQQGDVDIRNWSTDADYDQRALKRLQNKTALATVFETPTGNLDETGVSSFYHAALAERRQAADPLETQAAAAK